MLQYFSESKQVQDIKYAPEDFLFRWKKLERILEKEQHDALLMITGIDGSEYAHTNYLFNWLFLGLSGPAIFNNKYLDPLYSEMIIIVSPKESFIFITPQAKQQFEPLIHTLQNCTMFCPTEKQYAAKDSLDILKISFFYQSLSKLNKIGLFLASEHDVKIIEKWPIIQSYALEAVGRTFFTLRFQCSNLNQRLMPVFKNLDKHSLQNLVATTARALEGQVRGSTQLIEYTKQEERLKISELKLQQSLFEAADIAKTEINSSEMPPVRVLFGARTGSKVQSSAETIESTKAYHFTLEHGDPITRLQVWRTYFFNTCQEQIGSIQRLEEEEKESFLTKIKYIIDRKANPAVSSRKWLVLAYLGLVQGVLDGISTVSKDYRNLNKQFLLTHILAKINQTVAPNGAETFNKNDLEIYLESYDAQGDPKAIDFKDSITFKLSTSFYVLKIRLNNVKHSGVQLGSICFSESFLLQEGCYLLLTKQTPYFDFWKTDAETYSALDNLNPNIEFPELGESQSPSFKYKMFIPLEKLSNLHFNIPLIEAHYSFHSKGIKIHSQKTGWHLLLYKNIIESTMINKIPGQWVLFRTKSAFLFQGIQTNILAIQFRGKAFDCLLKKVNDKTEPLPLSFLDFVPPLLADNWYFTQEVLKKQVKEGALLHQHQILQNEFLWSFIESKQLMVLNQMKDIKMNAFKSLYVQKANKSIEPPAPSDRPALALITGTYTTGKYRIAQTLARFGKKQTNYHIFHVSYENLFSRMEVSTFIEMLDQFIKEAPEAKNRLFLVVIPAWLNAAQVIPALNDKHEVKTVISAISVGGFYSTKNGVTADNALTFAVPGFAQSIVLDSRGESEAQISSIYRIVRLFNRQVRVTRSSNSTLSTGQVSDLLSDNYYNSEYHRFLRQKYGSLYRFNALNQLQIGYMEFKYPICDIPALKLLSQQEGWLVDWKTVRQELREKREEALNSKDQLMEMLYNLEQSITMLRKRQKVPRIRCIKGVVRTQEGEKVELLWSGLEFRERPVADKDRTLGIFVMANKYDEYQIKEFFTNLTYKKFIMQGLKNLREKGSITEEERIQISRQGKGKYLENGQFYDGYFYRDVQGHILGEHPQLERLLEEWIAECNREIEAHNQSVRQEWENYRKQYD